MIRYFTWNTGSENELGLLFLKVIIEGIQQERMVKVRIQHHVSDRMPVR